MMLSYKDTNEYIGTVSNSLFQTTLYEKYRYLIDSPYMDRSNKLQTKKEIARVYTLNFQRLGDTKKDKDFKVKVEMACTGLTQKEALTICKWLSLSNEYFNWNKYESHKFSNIRRLAFIEEMEKAFNKAVDDYVE